MALSADIDGEDEQGQSSTGIRRAYDFIVCGSGSSGSVVARRLAENPDVNVLLIEAGGTDDLPEIIDPLQWPTLRGSAQEWGFRALANPRLNGRSIPMAMGRVLGGGSSINVMSWSRGHRVDWDDFAAIAGDAAWNYHSVLEIYSRIENWQGARDPRRRGTSGPIFIDVIHKPSPLEFAALQAYAEAGIPQFDDQNGIMMEGDGGVALTNVCIRGGVRQSIYRAYVHPLLGKPNLTMVNQAIVTKVALDENRAESVEFLHGGRLHRVSANCEIILSLGAINTPKILMLSGIGDERELARFEIPVVQNLPGVGRNFQDHFMAPCVWQAGRPLERHGNLGNVTAIWKSNRDLDRPDLQSFVVTGGYASPQAAPTPLPPDCWSLTSAVLRITEPGRLRLTSNDPLQPVEIDAHFLASGDDRMRLRTAIDFSREVGNSKALADFRKAEILPGGSDTETIEAFMRNGTVSHSHQSCTARMGRDAMSVVDSRLRVYGIANLRIADASVLPRVTTGNTMAPCVVIGERAGEILQQDYRL
ncbi:GMC family oxidoreductase N-terminal domain-containing protein [Rhizobium sp. NFR07]|uniref:GMC family oxidoreductase n=1 Tax=Rhizobium sp. NFR07 TaxID=1566262 RepID=UPI000B84552A|nr:GMC family oxidoreductase N-terminal domain-containing protein [Rhizobium sp. NFR07]